jgi:DNA replication protein DnaC
MNSNLNPIRSFLNGSVPSSAAPRETGCDLCTFGLIDPPALAHVKNHIEERLDQYRAGLLAFCTCDFGQRQAAYYARMASVDYAAQLAAEQQARRAAWLQRIDGLKPQERTITFDRIVIGEHNQRAYQAVTQAVDAGVGIVTLTGTFGVGKSALLMAAVNAARGKGTPAVYTTITDLLDWLREAFDPHRDTSDGPDLSFDSRWRLLTTCDVLAIDELDEFNATPWATERFLRLIDERWRSMDDTLTLCALNQPVERLVGKVASRLRDGRAVVVEVKGADMRRYQERVR